MNRQTGNAIKQSYPALQLVRAEGEVVALVDDQIGHIQILSPESVCCDLDKMLVLDEQILLTYIEHGYYCCIS